MVMAISAISKNITTTAVESTTAKTRQGGTYALKPLPAPGQDTVELSNTARAKSLKLLGETPIQIAQTMGADIKSVNGYLGIQIQAPVTAATPAPKTAEKTAQASLSFTA